MAGELVAKTMKKLEKLVDGGVKSEKVNVGVGIQDFATVGMMGSDYLDIMNAAHRGKEILKGKERTSSINVSATAGAVSQVDNRELSREELEHELKQRGIPLDLIGR